MSIGHSVTLSKKEREKAEMVRIEKGIVWKLLNILINL